MSTSPAKRESGFTLVELLVSIAILGVVVAPLSASLILALRSTAATQSRFTDSRGAQTTAAYFANDVQSAASVTVDDNSGCGGSGNGPAVVSFRWNDGSAAQVVSYAVRTVEADRQLVRRACDGGGAAVDAVVAHGLAAAPPVVSCTPSCAAARSVSLRVSTEGGFAFDLHGARRSQ